MMTGLIRWLDAHLLPCPVKSLTGLDCPGCGIQRSFIALLQGDLQQSWQLFPALLPLLFTLLLTIVHIRLRFKNGARYVQYSYMATAAIVIVSYLLKMAA